MDEQKDPKEDFSYLQETIKEGKFTKKKLPKMIVIMIVLGAIFGIASSAGFVAAKPWIESIFGMEETVSIPLDEAVEEEAELTQNAMDEVKEEIKQEIIDETENDELQITDYEQIYAELYLVAQEASKSTVTVQENMTAEQEAQEVLDQLEGLETTATKSVTGLIVAQTSSEILILTPVNVLESMDNICVKLSDGSEFAAKVKQEYEILGYGIISVSLTGFPIEDIEVAELGNSLIVQQGDVAIALGNQFDYEEGLGYGVISSTKNELSVVDGSYALISTDIPVATDGTGILLNTSGQVIGLINTQLTDETAVDAIGISQVKLIIEALSNGLEVPYLGIKGVEITEEMSEQLGMPVGLYIQSVEAESPALEAGIRSGDIIVAMNETEIKTIDNYQNELLKTVQNDIIKILVQRKGQEEYVDIEIVVVVGVE